MQSQKRIISKTPAELDFYTLNYATNDLGADIISGSSWATADPSLTVNNPPASNTDATTTVWLGGGTISTIPVYAVNTADTQGGRQFVDAIGVVVRQYNFIYDLRVRKMSTALLDYTLDWSPRVSACENETIVSSTWSASDPALNVAASPSTIGTTGDNTTVWMSGGAVNTLYVVTNTVVTSTGRNLENSFRVYITPNLVC